jgi:hypothetical protein
MVKQQLLPYKVLTYVLCAKDESIESVKGQFTVRITGFCAKIKLPSFRVRRCFNWLEAHGFLTDYKLGYGWVTFKVKSDYIK